MTMKKDTRETINRIICSYVAIFMMLAWIPSRGYAESVPALGIPVFPKVVSPAVPEVVTVAEKPVTGKPVVDSRDITEQTELRVLTRVAAKITPESGGVLELGSMRIDIPAHAVDSPMDITLEELGTVPDLNAGLENTTGTVAGYRALPHGTQFLQYVKVTIPYDAAKADTEAKRAALNAYFYDETRQVWTKLERTGIDEKNSVIESVTTHFTDFITATLKLPDSPKPLNFNPTSIKDIKAADPSAGVPSLEGLEANQNASANFQIPLRIPAGRKGMNPSLAISYSSGGSSGWMGQGFDISVPSISIDTSKRLAQYDEHDVYLLNGRPLVKVGDKAGYTQYRPLVEGDFAEIRRIPASGHQYYWEVRATNGITTMYGGTSDSVNGPDSAHDFKWYQNRVEDANGNWMRYAYSGSRTTHLYLQTIDYTLYGTGAEGGYYRIKFNNGIRDDRRVDMRGGYPDKMDMRLASIDVQFYDPSKGSFSPIRQYVFKYSYSAFGKSRLDWYQELDQEGKEFYKYAFTYNEVNRDKTTGKIIGLSDSVAWSGSTQESFSTSINGGANLGFGADVIFPWPVHIVGASAGVNVSGGGSWTYENATSLDINGDGIPDLIEHNMKGDSIYLGRSNGSYASVSSSFFPSGMWSWLNSSTAEQTNLDLGFFGNLRVAGKQNIVASLSYTDSTNNSDTTWSYMDIDGDGLVDIVNSDSSFYYHNESKNGVIQFGTRNYGATSATTRTLLPAEETLKTSHLLDPLRMWMSNRSGTIEVAARASSAQTDTAWDGARVSAYAVHGKSEAVAVGESGLVDSKNSTVDLKIPSMNVNKGDHLVFRQSSEELTDKDNLTWNINIRYKTINLFSNLTNERYAVLPQTYQTQGAADYDFLKNYYTSKKYYTAVEPIRELTVNEYTGTRDWTIKNATSEPDDTIKSYFLGKGYFIFRKLSQQDYAFYSNSEAAYNRSLLETIKQYETDNVPEADRIVKQSDVYEVWSTAYQYEPLDGVMVLTESSLQSPVVKRQIFERMTMSGIRIQQQDLFPVSAMPSAIDQRSGRVVSNQNFVTPVSQTADSVGFCESRTALTNTRVLVEKIRHIDGKTTRVYMRPFYSTVDGLHVEVQAEGGVTGVWTDRWIDGSTPLNASITHTTGPTAEFWINVTGNWPAEDQKRNFSLQYAPYETLDRDIGLDNFLHTSLKNELTETERTTIIQTMEEFAATNMKERYASCFDKATSGDTYSIKNALSSDEKAFALWAQILAHKVEISTSKSRSLTSAFEDAFLYDTKTKLYQVIPELPENDKALVLWIQTLTSASTFTGVKAVYASDDYQITDTKTNTTVTATQNEFFKLHEKDWSGSLTDAQYADVLSTLSSYVYVAMPATDDYADVDSHPENPVHITRNVLFTQNQASLITNFDGASLTAVNAAIDSVRAEISESVSLKSKFTDMLVLDTKTSKYSVKENLSGDDLKFLLWWELCSSTVTLEFFKADAKTGDFAILEDNGANPEMLFSFPSYNLFDYIDVSETVMCDSETMFTVKRVPASGKVQEYEFGEKTVNPEEGTTDAIIVSYLDSSTRQTEERLVYVHEFDSIRDFSSKSHKDKIDYSCKDLVSLPSDSILFAYSGGGNNWFYADWNGYPKNNAYSEALVRKQMAVFQQDDEDSVKNTSTKDRQDCQVIWSLKWDASRNGGAWVGAIYTKQITEWNPSSRKIDRRILMDSSYVTGSETRSFRLGGDDPILASPTAIEAGGNLSWVRGSEGSSQTFNVNGTLAYTSGSSSGVYDLIDMNGDRFPDMITQGNGGVNVYLSKGESPVTGISDGAPVSFNPIPQPWGGSTIRKFDNSAVTFSASITKGSSQVNKPQYKVSGKAGSFTYEPASASDAGGTSLPISAGGSITVGASYKKNDLIDLNGDGLPDLVSRGTGNALSISINNGHGFQTGDASFVLNDGIVALLSDSINSRYGSIPMEGAVQDIVIGSPSSSLLSFSGSTSVAVNGSFNGSLGGLGFTAGIGVSVSTDRSYFDFMDLNGDGLPDLLIRINGSLYVCFNQGDRFYDPVLWGSKAVASISLNNVQMYNSDTNVTENVDIASITANTTNGIESPLELNEEISSSTTIGFSVNGGLSGSVSFPIFTWIVPIPFCPPLIGKIEGTVTAGASIGGGVNLTKIEYAYGDVNGDGLPDNMLKTSNGMAVRLNETGMDGLLKTIELPQGGMIDLAYKPSVNTPDDPNRRFELRSVTRTNWKEEKKPDPLLPTTTVVTAFEYAGGYYDRDDRAFWGYKTVSTLRMDGAAVAGKTVVTYKNKDYYLKDKPETTETFDGNNVLLSKQVNSYVPQYIDVQNGQSVWPCLVSTRQETHSDGNILVNETRYTAWDSYGYGLPTEVCEFEGITPVQKYRINIGYRDPSSTGNHLLAALPESLRVTDSKTNALLRYREGWYDDYGNMTEQRSYWDDTPSAYLKTTMTDYDTYGNLLSQSDDSGYTLSYEYESILHSYVSKVTDSHHMTTSWTYDYLQGVETSQTDANETTIEKDYDASGRMVEVRTPYDTGTVKALSFKYETGSAFPWRAITKNKISYKPTDDGIISTVVVVDGLGSMIQTKKSTVVTNPSDGAKKPGWNVSAWTVPDALGREKQTGMPLFDPDDLNTGLYTAAIRSSYSGSELYSENTYDSRDRIIETKLPDGSRQSTEYKIDSFDGEYAWRMTSTDPEKNKKRSWSDASSLTLAVVQDPAGINAITRFTYDGIGQMLSSIDADGNTMRIEYDALGRKTGILSPDSGLVTYVYDAKGDLSQKIDPVLRAKSLAINYVYDMHRLKRTDYPDSSVTYAYGDDPDVNNMGQLIETKNDDVTERTTYGPLGEVLTVARDVKTRQPGVQDYDWVIRYAYNYLGQMTDITYPNAETVSYHYDAGGQVDGITGTCLGHDVTYVRDIGYDYFGQRVSLAYGNGTTTTYEYDPARRWLKSLSTVLDSTRENLQTLSYSFDLNGNVTYFKDTSETKTYEQTYGYDDLDQLISARGDYIDTKSVVVRTANYTQAYNYDRIGNMLGKTSTLVRNPAKAEDQKLNYSLSYAYEGKGPHQATMVGDTHYVYDDNGNVTSMVPDWEWKNYSGPKYADFTVRTVSEKLDVADAALGADRSPADQQNMSGTRYMEWDWENRLTGVKEGRMSVAYAYDAGGERRLKVEGATETVYWDRMYEVENSSSYPVASIHVYLGTSCLVSKLSILDNPDFLTESGNTFYYHADHLGSSSLITDNKGREYERMAFTPHGEVWQHDTLDTLEKIDLLFTGKAMDAETGWYYFGARYLDPRTGMWLSGDPALGEYVPQAPLTQEAKDANGNLPGMGGVYNPVNLALYHYAGNNPIKYLDPDGRLSTGAPYTDIGTQFIEKTVAPIATTGIFSMLRTAVPIIGTILMAQPLGNDDPLKNGKSNYTVPSVTTENNKKNQVIIQIQGVAVQRNWRDSAGGGTLMGTIRSDKPITAEQVQSKMFELLSELGYDEKGAVAKPVVDVSKFLERAADGGGVYGSGSYRGESKNQENRVDLIWSGEVNLTKE